MRSHDLYKARILKLCEFVLHTFQNMVVYRVRILSASLSNLIASRLSSKIASILNGLTVGDPLPENLMESPARSENRSLSLPPGSNDDHVAMICDHQSKIKRSICDGILKLLDSWLITLDEDSQLKAIEFGLSDFVKLGWSSKLQVEVRWTVEETTKMSLMTKGYFHNLLDMLLDTTHMCHFSCVYELFRTNYIAVLPHQFEEYRLPRLGIGWARESKTTQEQENSVLDFGNCIAVFI
ncbi:14-3-3-like protein GF14 omega [Prunus dulcis]|uniref:14-3-3-like protein GF14 omega n=1 Tax=Prunus dulcis TaxID=3755 RepID=A0A4Y1RM56_PRUDU|nr:14-3-3-like protein GF14 omega [Prunus dulcis]